MSGGTYELRPRGGCALILPPSAAGVSMKPIFASPANGAYLYRAVDSTVETIDFILSPKRDAVAAKHFLQLAL